MVSLPANYDKLTRNERRQVRQEYVRRQNGRCWHCGESLSSDPAARVQATPVTESLFPDGFFRWPVHLHHDHNTGMTIGAIHARCNAVLWEYFGE